MESNTTNSQFSIVGIPKNVSGQVFVNLSTSSTSSLKPNALHLLRWAQAELTQEEKTLCW